MVSESALTVMSIKSYRTMFVTIVPMGKFVMKIQDWKKINTSESDVLMGRETIHWKIKFHSAQRSKGMQKLCSESNIDLDGLFRL